MKAVISLAAFALVLCSVPAYAQYKTDNGAEAQNPLEIKSQDESSQKPIVLSLEQALQVALSENISVKVADKEIVRANYAKKGTYAALFPQIDFTGAYQRTIKKQVMYMDFDMSSLGMGSAGGSGSSEGGNTPGGSDSGSGSDTGMSGDAGSGSGSVPGSGSGSASTSKPSKNNGGGLEVGRWNSISGGVSASMPIINAQLWKSIQISAMDVELAVEKARASRLDMVSAVKNAYYAVLMAKQAFEVYKEVYENAVENYEETEKKAASQKASALDVIRAKTNVSNAIPNVYNAESSIILALWQLKAVMGVDLDTNIDVAGALSDYADTMFRDIHDNDNVSLEYNSTMRQLAIQAEELAQTIKMQKYAYLPSLALSFNYSYNTMANDVSFSEWKWTPYSVVGVSLSIPIFSGGRRLNQVRQTKTAYEQMKLQQTDVERNLRISIRRNLSTMETNMKSYNAANSAVETAEKAYEIAKVSYEVGRATLTDLNDAQLALTQARLAQSQAIYNFVIAKASLEQTLGQDFLD